MRQVYTADCETDPFKYGRVPRPFIWGLYSELDNKVEYKEFIETADFIEYIIDKPIIVYAHNGGKFDWHFVLDWIEPFAECSIINGRLSKFKIGECEFRDSYNILPVPLAAYKKDDFDYDKMEVEVRHLHMPEIKKYLKADCSYLFEIVQRFISDYGLNLTLAGAALKTWQKISEEKAPETTNEYYEEIKPFYYGGRVECFESGIIDERFNVVDINSAYPFAMMKNHPYGQMPFISDELPETLEEIQRAFITLECKSAGALPYRELDGSLRFPNDNIKRVFKVTGWEYLAGLNTDTISEIKIIEVLTFSSVLNFRQYIDHFYAMKKECKENEDQAGYLLAKLFLNSLYGKFGSNPNHYKKYMFVNPRYIEAAEQDDYEYAGEVGNWALMQSPLEESEMRFYDVAVAASITGFVRAYMWESITKCKGVIYCDTDSIAARDSSGLDYHPTKLGAWDIEADCDYGAVGGKKLYAFRDINGKWKCASKGVRFDYKQIVNVCMGKIEMYENDAPTFSVRKNPTFMKRKVAFNAKTE